MDNIKIHNTLIESEELKYCALIAYDFNIVLAKKDGTINVMFVLSKPDKLNMEINKMMIKCPVRIGSTLKDKVMKIVAENVEIIQDIGILVNMLNEGSNNIKHVLNISRHIQEIFVDELLFEFDR